MRWCCQNYSKELVGGLPDRLTLMVGIMNLPKFTILFCFHSSTTLFDLKWLDTQKLISICDHNTIGISCLQIQNNFANFREIVNGCQSTIKLPL